MSPRVLRRLSRALSSCLPFATLGLCSTFTALGHAQMSFVDHTFASGVDAMHMPSVLFLTGGTIYAYLNAGGFAGDFNGDGAADLFVVGGGSQPDRFFVNMGNGTFTEQSAQWGVNVHHMGIGGAVGDYDGDGWPDLFVTSLGLNGGPPQAGKHRLYRNLNGRTFENVASAAGVAYSSPMIFDGSGACFGDYDLDGNLDLMVAGWMFNSQGNRLFRNNGNGTFTDVTVSSGLSAGLVGVRGFSPRIVDMDGDGWPEILLAADFKTSRYFRNMGDGTFVNATVASGTGLDDNGMGHTVADLDGDGRPDWFVTSIWQPGGSMETPGTGNMLYSNVGPHQYAETAQAAGVHDARWGWGTTAADFDHDGVLDLIATNGWITQPYFQNTPTRVWRGLGNGTYVDVAATSGLWHTGQGRGLLTMDFDGDGALDVVIFANQEKVRLYRNTLVNDGTRNWIRIKLDTTSNPRLAPHGVGSVVSVLTDAGLQHRWVEAGTNYQAQDELIVHFGLGAADEIDALRIRWSNGISTVLTRTPANQTLTIEAGEPCDLNHDGRVDGADLGMILVGWGPCAVGDPRDLNADGAVDGLDMLLLLQNWTG